MRPARGLWLRRGVRVIRIRVEMKLMQQAMDKWGEQDAGHAEGKRNKEDDQIQ